jgi:hypothetical protein
MGLWDSIKDIGGVVAAPLTGGLSLVGMSENTRSKIPLLGGLTGAQSDAEKALIKKQQQMAEDARKQKIANEQARMNALGQQMLAFNPRNQVMAQMFGPDAAFSPQQMGQMAADPGAKSDADYHQAWQQSMASGKPMQNMSADDLARMEADRRRQAMVAGNMQPLPRAAAPLQQRTPQPGRRY